MIRLDNIGVTYDNGAVALHDLSLELRKGEFAVLLGTSGAGKSTLLRCVNYLTRPTSGRVSVEGLGTLSDPETLREHRKRTGMIFQQHQLIYRHTALQNVLVGRLAYHPLWRSLWLLPLEDRYIALDCLERVGLLDRAMVRVKSLSGGQQQRVGVARALAQQPQYILADEPVASLDPNSANRVLTLLRQICQEDRIGALVSLHQVELALKYADRIIGLSQGQVVYDGPPSGLDRDTQERIYSSQQPISVA